MHTFYLLGKKYVFSPFFSSPFNHFFPQHVIWPYFCPRAGGGGKQKNIHPCQEKEVNAGEDPKPSGSGTNSPQEITGDSSKRKK